MSMSFIKFIAPTSLMSLLLVATACDQNMQTDGDPETGSRLDTVSYSLGYFYGSSMANEGIEEFNYTNFVRGLRAAVEKQDAHFDEMSMQMALQNFQMDLQQIQQQRADQARQESDQFLAENATRNDVHVTDSGLQYRIIEQGDGASPDEDSVVRVHYRGTLINGEEFDSSHSRGEPAEFPLDRVIPGWTEGLQLMQEGGVYEFVIPSDLAYGNNPPPGPITAGATLIFEVELLEIVEENGNGE